MKKSILLMLTLMSLMLLGTFTSLAYAAGPTQPEVITDTLYVGSIGWGPRDADPFISYDTGSGQLLFQCYENLIAFGEPVTNDFGTWDTYEQYWEYSPQLATNVPDRVELNATFTQTVIPWVIVIRNEMPLDPGWINAPICTWWEDDLVQPFNSYHITGWEDNGNGELDFCDNVTLNDYWWAPEIPLENELKDVRTWHVVEVQFHEPDTWKIVLEYIMEPGFDPTDPVCTWWTSVDYPDKIFHMADFTDNTADGEITYCDVVYLMEFDIVPVFWEKIGEGYTLLPVTARAWHVREDVDYGPPVVLYLHHWYYDFNIRTEDLLGGGPIYFVNTTGHIVDTFDINDVEYSFERAMALDSPAGPIWMLWLPCLDAHSFAWGGSEEMAILGAYLIDDTYEIISVDPPVFRINTAIAFPDGAFKQTISQSWAGIVSREYTLAHRFAEGASDFSGDLFLDEDQNCWPDWLETFHGEDTNSYYEVAWDYAGTGPYFVSVVDDALEIVVLEKNDLYWMGWPAPGRKDYLEVIEIDYISEWSTRRDAYIACQLDVCSVPRAYMEELLDEHHNPLYEEMITIMNIYPGLALDATHFTFDINPASPYIGTGTFPDGIPPNFFNNTHVRKAFAYAFNRTQYLVEGYFGEAVCRDTPLISGLAPDYYSYGPDPPWVYDIDYDAAEAELKAAMFDGTSVWDSGFMVEICYNTGNDQRMIANLMMRDFFAELSTYDGRSGPAFDIHISEILWPAYISEWYSFNLPVWAVGWLADYADADNWMGAYMHSWICFAYFQVYQAENGWGTLGPATGLDKDALVEMAIKVPDGPERAALYKDLEDIWIMDCPALPVAEPLGRAWRKYWLKGWYYNGLYPSMYYYHLYKEDTCYANVHGTIPGVPDETTNMRDIGYIANHFGARAPDPGLGYDDRWAPGAYGMAGCDIVGDRIVNMRDIGTACAHFGHGAGDP